MKDISKLTALKETDLDCKNLTSASGIIKDTDKELFHLNLTGSDKKLVFYKKNSAIFTPKKNETATCYFPDHTNDSFPIAVIQSKFIVYIKKEFYKQIKHQKEEKEKEQEVHHYMPKFKF